MKKTLIGRPDLAEVERYYRAACAVSRAHTQLVAGALYAYGDHGPYVSTVVGDHFPTHVKELLRGLARLTSYNLDMAMQSRPNCVRMSTIIALGCEVAKQDGCGFYGPKV